MFVICIKTALCRFFFTARCSRIATMCNWNRAITTKINQLNRKANERGDKGKKMGNGLCDLQDYVAQSEEKDNFWLNLDNSDARQPKLEGPKLNRKRIFRSLPSFLKMPLNAKLIFVIFLSRFLRHQRVRSSFQLFSRRRMSFGKIKLGWKVFHKEQKRLSGKVFNSQHVTKLHNVARWLCDYFRYDNLFIISCSLLSL